MSRRDDDEWAAALAVFVVTASVAVALPAARLVLGWGVGFYRERWPHPGLTWPLAGLAASWILAALLGTVAPDLAAVLVALGVVGYVGGLVAAAAGEPRSPREREPTVVQVLGPWWPDADVRE